MRWQKFKSIFTNNNCNPYRGCEHDCIYCDARSKVYNIEGEFTDVIGKENAVEYLEQNNDISQKIYEELINDLTQVFQQEAEEEIEELPETPTLVADENAE
mgnify:CR=1 FL=1